MNYKINVSYTAESSGKKIEDFFYIAGEDDLLGDVDYIKETYCRVKDYYYINFGCPKNIGDHFYFYEKGKLYRAIDHDVEMLTDFAYTIQITEEDL